MRKYLALLAIPLISGCALFADPNALDPVHEDMHGLLASFRIYRGMVEERGRALELGDAIDAALEAELEATQPEDHQ